MKIIRNRIPMERRPIIASDIYVLSFQLEGLCLALRRLIECRLDAGPSSRILLKRIRDAFVNDSSGHVIDCIPDVTEDMNTADLLSVAEVLRTTVMAFLSPEEGESRGKFGFQPPRQ